MTFQRKLLKHQKPHPPSEIDFLIFLRKVMTAHKNLRKVPRVKEGVQEK